MKLASLLLALSLTASAQSTQPSAPQFTDPANLRGERVQPRDGRELPIDTGASGLEQLLRRLNTRASIMNIVAHPDDEDGGMLTLYSRGLGARVADLSLNRGEGGQNAMTADFEDALGLLRTQELLSADRYTGVDQFFGTEVDFGFSKTKEEAFAKWTHDRVLYDVVRAVRLYRPLVLTSTWIGSVTDGHGQHQVAGQIAQEAFLAAGDPKVFPELTAEGILPWQPLRIYARVPHEAITDKGLYDYATNQFVPATFTNYVTGEVTTTVPTTDVIVHEGTPDPLLDGKTYLQFARLGLAQQKSQMGPQGVPTPTGTYDVPFHLYGDVGLCFSGCHPRRGSASSASPAQDTFFTGIDTSLTGIATLAPQGSTLKPALASIAALIDQATKSFHPANSEAIAPTLADALKQTNALIDTTATDKSLTPLESASVLHELNIKQAQLTEALTLALGLSLEATTDTPTSDIPVGTDVPVKITLTKTSSTEVDVFYDRKVIVNANSHGNGESGGDSTKLPLPQGTLTTTLTLTADDTIIIRRPYFKRSSIEQPVYDILDPALRDAPQTLPSISVFLGVRYKDVPVMLSRIVHPLSNDQPINFVPPISVSLSSHAQVLPSNRDSIFLNILVTPSDRKITEQKLNGPSTWKVAPASVSANCVGCFPFHIDVPSIGRKPTTITATAQLGGHTYTEGYRTIGYGNLPRTNYFTPATTRIVPVDLKLTAHKKIAYLHGTGDSVPDALTSIGLTPTMLTVADLTTANLAQYDTIVLGVRTYAAHPDLHGAPTQTLLDYARNGGNVVVQYQTTEFTAADAPYPLSLGSNEKVVDETAPVQLIPQNSEAQNSKLDRILTTPNLLTPADFNNWIEERGHGFLATWEPQYTALTETHDPGQAPQRGGLITTEIGKGHWTYCAFALYRQLPEAVPGAFRLFVNLLNP
jgi:LmbE family N-acetylglucosaminyl deacetylase